MARFKTSIRPYHVESRPNINWVLNVWHQSGRRSRFFFKTLEEAKSEEHLKRIEVENYGLRGLNLSDRARFQAMEAEEKLKPFGVSIADVVAEYIKRHKAVCDPIETLAAAYIDSRAKIGRSEKHQQSLARLFKRFAKAFKEKSAKDITPEDIEQWFDTLGVGACTINTYRSLLHSLFAYGVIKRRCPENPVKLIERRAVVSGKVGILSPEQLQRLLEVSSGDIRAHIAIGAFAGVRPEEIARLTWEEIDLEENLIDVAAEKSKTARQRYVKILPVLAAWLKPLVATGSIHQDNFRRRFDEARRQAGFRVRGNLQDLKPEDQEQRVPWPHDALRHSFASYHIAKFQDTSALALQLGHESNALIFSNYRHRVKERDAVTYFNLLPPGTHNPQPETP